MNFSTDLEIGFSVIVGGADDVTAPKLALHYKDRLAKLGRTVKLVRIGDAGHNIFLAPEVLQAISQAVSELATKSGQHARTGVANPGQPRDPDTGNTRAQNRTER